MPATAIKMGLWIGAAWQRSIPNAPMMIGGPGPKAGAYSGFKGLMVNRNAVRFTNEDINRTHTAYPQMQQPERHVFVIWNWESAQQIAPWFPFGSYIGSPERSTTDIIDGWEKNVETGIMVKADTIDDLALKLRLDPRRLKATTDRYNTFCEKTVGIKTFINGRASFSPFEKARSTGNPTTGPGC